MKITYRFAHLKELPELLIGQTVEMGDVIGIMGSTGQSTGDHSHIDAIEGLHSHHYRLKDMKPRGALGPRPDQILYLLEDDGLFKQKPIVTSGYCDLRYWTRWDKIHYGWDVIPADYNEGVEYPIYWNRSGRGVVLATRFDTGYGNYIMIGCEE